MGRFEGGGWGGVHKPGLSVALIRTPALFDLAAALAEAPFRDVDYLEGTDSWRAFKDIWGRSRLGEQGRTLKTAPYYDLVTLSFICTISLENKVPNPQSNWL